MCSATGAQMGLLGHSGCQVGSVGIRSEEEARRSHAVRQEDVRIPSQIQLHSLSSFKTTFISVGSNTQ